MLTIALSIILLYWLSMLVSVSMLDIIGTYSWSFLLYKLSEIEELRNVEQDSFIESVLDIG